MTVTANTTRNDYVGNGQSVYSYTFQLNDASDVTVYLDGVVQTLNTHYTVENVGVGSGGTITFTLVDENNNPIHPTSSQAISIVMAMDLDRDTNYQQSGLFAASDVNNDFDRLWLASNQQQTAINRSLRLQDDDATTGNMELPSKDDRKGKLLGFNATTGLPETSDNNNSNWNAAYNNMITSASFSGGNYTLTQQDGGTISTSLDGRYLPLSGGTLTGNLVFASGRISLPNLDIYKDVYDTSVIEETGLGHLIIKGTDVRIQTSDGEDVIQGQANGAVTLYYDNAAKLATTNTGISVTGTLSATGYNDSNWNTAYSNHITGVSYSGNTLTLTQQDGGTIFTTINASGGGGGGGTATGVDLADNVHATFGDNNELQILHNGNNGQSIIMETGSGDLSLHTNGSQVNFYDSANSNQLAEFKTGAECSLRYNGDEKFKTTSTGIDVTGGITASGNILSGTDSAHDLGSSSKRWKDLYLSNKVYTNYIGAGGDTDTYMRFAGSNQTLWVNGGSEAMRIASNGKVGIGTASPATALHVFSGQADEGLRIESADQYADIHLKDANGSSYIRNNNGSLILEADRANASNGTSTIFQLDGSEMMRINQLGNVGIGTSSPDEKLVVKAGSYSSSQDGGIAVQMGSDTGSHWKSALKIKSNATGNPRTVIEATTGQTSGQVNEAISIHTSGNVGIGTSSPAYALDVNSGTNNVSAQFQSTDDTVSIYLKDNDTTNKIHSSAAGVRFDVSGSERMRIDSLGRLGIGTTSPTQSLHVNSGATNVVSKFESSDAEAYIQLKETGGSTLIGSISGATTFYSDEAFTERMRIDSSGNVGIGTTTPSSKLHVSSGSSGITPDSNSTVFFDSSGSNTLQMGSGTYNSAALYFGNSFSASRAGIAVSHGGGSMAFRNYGSEAMRLNSSGYLGVGTTAPSARITAHGGGNATSAPASTVIQGRNTNGSAYIQLASNTYGSGGIYFGDTADNDAGGLIYSHYYNKMEFRVNTQTRMCVAANGMVGIATTSPTKLLDINGDTLRLRNSKTPASATATGNKGEICYDSDYMYVCVATNTWKRAALASW